MPVKVECDKCKTAFQLDERRIPPTGLRVRCPKCSHVFVVKKPEDRASALPADPSRQTPQPAAPAAPAPAAPIAAAPAPAAPAPRPASAASAPTRPEIPRPQGISFPKPSPEPAAAKPPAAAAIERPALEVPAPGAMPKPEAAAPPMGSPIPVRKRAATIAFAGAPPGLFPPGSVVPATAAPAEVPAKPAAAEPPAVKPPSIAPSFSDLPAVSAGPSAGGAARASSIAELDLPAMPEKPQPKQGPASKIGSLDDLPAVNAPIHDVGDLPAVAAKPSAPAKPVAPAFDDLPAVPARGPAYGDLPAVMPSKSAAAARPSPNVLDDLPAVPARGPAFGELGELGGPAPAHADLPAVHAKGPGLTDLPAVPSKPAGPPGIELPSIPKGPPATKPRAKTQVGLGAFMPQIPGATPPSAGAGGSDLPATRGLPPDVSHAPPRRPMAASLDDLPAVAAPIDLPAEKSPGGRGFGEVDLPAVTGNRDLPTAKHQGLADFDLPAVGQQAALPAQRSAGASFGEIDLPSVGSPGLPATRDGGVDLPSSAPPGAHLPAIGSAAKSSAPAGGGRGAFDPFADLGGSAHEPVSGGALGFSGSDLSPVAGMKARASDSAALRSSTSGGHDFGELELPGPGVEAPHVDIPTLGAASGENRPRRAPSLALDQAPPEVAAMISASASPSEAPHGRGEAGGIGFGEVDLGGGNEDALEFGAIPQEGVGGPPPDSRSAPKPAPAKKKEKTVEEEAAPKKSGAFGRVALGLFLAIGLGGAALEFTQFGAFGRHVIDDKLHAADHATRLQTMESRTREAFGSDALDKATAAIAQNDADVSALPRFAPLLAYAAYGELAHELRFGVDAGREQKARALLARVKVPADEADLARGTLDAVTGNLAGARTTLGAVLAKDPNNVDAAVTLGEVELRAKQPKAAVAAFEKAVKAQDSARARSGLIRALDANGDRARATKEAEATAKKFPNHAASRLYLARRAWEDSKNDAEALKWLEELAKPTVRAGAAPAEQVEASTLRGRLKLDRGLISEARKSFDDAITASRGVPVAGPQLGLGEVEMASGAFAKAIAKFQAAAEADPTLIEAKIGIARAQLKLEKPGEAKVTLQQVVGKDPKWAGEIGFWLGQAEEKLAPEKPGEIIKIYEAAIKGTPGEVKPYIALANLQAKQGLTADADKTIDAALAAVPATDKMHLAIGQLRFRQGRYEKALEHFDKAIALGPDNIDAKFERGRTLLRMDASKFEDGKKSLDEVEAKDKDYPGLALEMGLYYQQTHQLEEALKRYQKALSAAPNDVDVKLQVGRAMVESRDVNAEKTLREVLDSCSTGSSTPDLCILEARHWLGRALLNSGQATESMQYLKSAAEKGDANASYHLYYAWALLETGKFDDAELEANRTLELDKSLGDASWIRAEIMTRKGQLQDAIKEAKHALTLSPARYEAHATIATAQYRLNNEEAAIAEYREAIRHDPRNPKSLYWRYMIADIYYHRGTPASALTEIRDAVKDAELAKPTPFWLPKAHFYYGEAIRGTDKEEAKKQYKAWLDSTVGIKDPNRDDAKAALIELGQPYGGR